MSRSPSFDESFRAERRALRAAWAAVKGCAGRAAACAGVLAMFAPGVSAAEDLALPAQVEAKLSAIVAAYDRTLVHRAGDKVVIAIVTNASDGDSMRAASQLQAAFREVNTIGSLPHEEFVVSWKDGPSLVEACVRTRAAIVFVSTGLDHAIDPMVKALGSVGVLSIAGSLPYVTKGLVLGFDQVSGRPKVVINLTMARRQGLEFRAELLRLARVIQ